MRPTRTVATGALALAATLIATVAAVALAPGAAHAATASFVRTSTWSDGYVGSFTVRNDGSTAVAGWRVEFDLPTGTSVYAHWSADLTSQDGHHTFRNAAWNGDLAPGASTTFGWMARGTGEPTGCLVDGAPCGATGSGDLRSPSAPGDVRIQTSPGVSILWTPATDDRGVVGYQVFESGTLLRTVPASPFVFSTGNTLPPKVYSFGVRAVDAAGNVGPFGYVGLGTHWVGEDPPPAPTGVRVVGRGPGTLALAWDRAPYLPYNVPPISGYEVSVDGVVADRVGGNTATVAAGPGRHTVTVRAFNIRDRYSEPVAVTAP
jgi:hypothetical protein